MADLESLDIRINASAGQATSAIDTLIRKFGELNRALHNFGADSEYVQGLNNLVGGLERLGSAVSAIDPQQVRDISSALGKLATNGDKLAKISGKTFLSGVANESQKIAVASEQARKKAEELAASYNFDMKGEGVDRLATAIDKLQASAGNDQAIRDTKQEIENIITTYSRYENELHEVAKAENELIRNSHKKLNSDWAEQFGDSESAKSARGKLGIGTSSKQGGSGDSFITENESLGMQTAANESDNLSLALERLRQNEADAKNEFVGFYDVSETVSGGIQQVKYDIDQLCESLGIAAEKMKEMSGSAPADDGFMDMSGIDLDDEPWLQGDTASKVEQIAAAEEHAATAGQQMASALDQVGQAGNLFTPLAQGLQELSNVTFGDMTPLLQLKDVISKIGGSSGQSAANNLPIIAQGIQSLDVKVPAIGPELDALADGLRALGSPNITKAATALPFVADGLHLMENIKVTADVEALSNLAYAISRFGLANINKSIANMPVLAESLKSLISSLSALPPVSENTISLLNALGGLNVNASNAMRSMNGVSGGLRRYTSNARRAHRQSLSLAAAIGKMYANFFLLFRLIRKAGDAIELASQLKEVQNVVDVTFGDMADKMNDFAATAVDTIGMSELTAKQVGSRFQAMGTAMDIPSKMIRQTSEFVNVATNGYAEVSDSISDMSINLTKLAGDMASFYNQDYAEVAEKLNAIYTGQTRPLRAYGLDLTQATLQQWALNNGLDVEVKKMTQAEKTMLRYQYVMANTTAAQGDFQRTITTWANQTRIAQERMKQLMNVLGQIGIYTFKPLVMNFNNAMNTIVDLATSTLNSLGKIFGWQIEWSDAGVLQDEADGLEDIADGYDDASDSAKKFKNFLLGIDELNLLPDDKDGKGSGADDLSDLYGDFDAMAGNLNIKQTESLFDSLYDTLYKLGKRIGEVEKEWLQGIDWDSVYDKARNFGEGLADFLNGYLSDAELFFEKGKFIANGINTIANAIDGFFKHFDGWQFGVDLGSSINGFTNNLDWNVIQSAATEMAQDIAQTINGAFRTTEWDMVGHTIAEGLNTAVDFFYTLGDEINWSIVGDSIAEGVNRLFGDFNFAKAASTLNKWAKGLLEAMTKALKKTDWKMVGRQIGTFLAGIDYADIAKGLASVLYEAINAAGKIVIGMFNSAPLETTLLAAFAIPVSNSAFRSNIGRSIGAISSYVAKGMCEDIGKVLNGTLPYTFSNAFRSALSSGSVGDGITYGFNAVSEKLSIATKAVGGIASIAGEFVAVKDAVDGIMTGTGTLFDNIVQLSTAVGIATPALAFMFGIPNGLILAGAGAAAGAIAAIPSALDKISESHVLSVLAEDIGGATVTFSELAENYKSSARNITDGIDRMNSEHTKLAGMKDDLAEMLGGFELIKVAAESGASLTADALADLVGNIGEVKKAWEEYIEAQYDWLIQSTINNMNFIKSSRDLTEQEKQYFVDRINALEEAKNAGVAAVSEATAAVEEAWNEYNEVLNNPEYDDRGFLLTYKLDEAREKINEATYAMMDLGNATGLITDENILKINSALIDLRDTSLKLDYSDIDLSNLDNVAQGAVAYNEQLADAFDNAKNSIDEYVRNLEASGQYTASELAFETSEYYKQLSENATLSLEVVQRDMYDNFVKIFETNGLGDAEKYAKEVIKPFLDSFPVVIDEEGKRVEPMIGEALDEIFDNALEGDASERMSTIREKYFGAGEEMGNAITEGVLATAGAASVIDDISDSFDGMRKSGGQAANTVLNINQNMKRLDASALIRMKDEFDKTTLKAYDMKTKVENLTSTFGTMKDKLNSSKTFEGVKKSADDVIGGLKNIKDNGIEAADSLSANLSSMTEQIKTVYNDISSETDVFIGKVNDDFTKLFSADTWSTMITSIPNAFRKMWDETMNVMKSMWNEFSKWVNQNAVIQIPKTKVGNMEIGGTDIRLKIPKYETGGFPEDGFFYANHTEMVGSFSNGRTAVANNEQITEGIEKAVYRAMMDAMANGGSNVNVELHGDASTLFTAVVKENNNAIMRTGSSPIRR